MIQVTVTSPITLSSGIVQLTGRQIAARTGQIKVLDEKAGLAVIEKPVMFKAGEKFLVKDIDRYIEANCVVKKPNTK
jgi:hypothetical protein